MHRSLVLAVALSGVASVASPQVPAGPEFRVNTATGGQQWYPSISAAPTGEFVVVFTEPSFAPNGGAVWGQRYDGAGTPLGANFRVSSAVGPGYNRGDGRVAVAPDGRFLVVWKPVQGLPATGQVFSPQGVRLGSEFTFGSASVSSLAIDMDDQGTAVAAWDGFTPADPDIGIAAQRIDRDGTPLGSALSVNTWTTGFQLRPDVAVAANGDFVVVWNSYDQDGSYRGVFGQRFDAQGTRRGGEFRVNETTAGPQQFPSIAADRDGAFVVAWESLQDGSGYAVYARRYASDGTPSGGEFRVNTTTARDQMRPSVDGTADGDFVVAWLGETTLLDIDVYAQRYDASGVRLGAEFRVNSYTPFTQTVPEVEVVDAGNFIVGWNGVDGSATGIFGRRYVAALVPVALGVDSPGNGVLEAGETVPVSPSWQNATGAGATFTGTASGFTGPGSPNDPSYTIPDAAADYGLIPNAATGSCLATGDCYALSVSAPTVRPAPHWDASFAEALSTGDVKTWTVHLGDTFGDVPRTNPFYRLIETLLHKGVTGGCGAGTYCPSASTLREQMAVFVLVAREGPGYQPPACTTPMFNDVPAASPYCRYIEELTRRGVVTGCGGGSYCPQTAVTREQMAVFVLRTLDSTLDPPACISPVFDDVPASSPFCRWIEELARRGVVTGCGGGSYCPANPVTREQMSVFISVTFGLTLYGP